MTDNKITKVELDALRGCLEELDDKTKGELDALRRYIEEIKGISDGERNVLIAWFEMNAPNELAQEYNKLEREYVQKFGSEPDALWGTVEGSIALLQEALETGEPFLDLPEGALL